MAIRSREAQLYCNQVAYGPNPSYASYTNYFDDLYILDGTGTNNTFLGPCQVLGVFPYQDTATEQWTPSSGTTHFSLVDETLTDTTSYVTGTSGQEDLYLYNTTPLGTVNNIKAIQVNTAAKVSSGSASLSSLAVSGGNTASLAQTVAQTSYADERQIIEFDPAAGALWTVTSLAAANIGVKAN